MSLSQFLESKFRADVRFRGAAYVHSERVAIARVTADDLRAVVRDGGEHHVHLIRENEKLRLLCSCWGERSNEATCKHVWATILCAEKAGYVSSPNRSGHVAPFRSTNTPTTTRPALESGESETAFLEDDLLDEEALETGPVQHLWEMQLAEIEERLDDRNERSRRREFDGQIRYTLDLAQSRVTKRLVVDVQHRERRRDGNWGRWKPLRVRVEELKKLPDEDRRILSYLSGAHAPDNGTNASGPQRDTRPIPSRFHMPQELSRLVLPLLCQDERLILRNSNSATSVPLTWNEQVPWELVASVCQDQEESDGDYCLSARLERDSEQRSLQDVALVIAGGLILIGNEIGMLDDANAADWIDVLSKMEELEVPSAEIRDFVERLLSLPHLPNMTLPEHLRLEEVCPEPVPHLLLNAPQRVVWRPERLRGTVCFSYEGHLVRGNTRQGAIMDHVRRRCLRRDGEREASHWALLESLGFSRTADVRTSQYDVEIVTRDLGSAVRTLLEHGWQVQSDGRQVRQPGNVQMRVRSRIDWFELHAQVDFSGAKAEFPELLSALARGDSAVRLDDGSLGILPEEWRQRYGLLAELGIVDEKHLRFRTDQVGLLDVLLASEQAVDYDERFEELRERIRDFAGIQQQVEPDGFVGHLRDYQKSGLGWLRFLHEFKFGGCLADDMGLGKTIQLLALLQESKRNSRKHRPSLVVVPKSLLFNWRQESERFTPDLSVLEYRGTQRAALRKSFPKHDLILTTYGTLRRDIVPLKDVSFNYVVLDEAQQIKNPRSQIAKATRLLKAKNRLALSGTPIENHISDLWSIFEFLNPGMLGHSSILKLGTGDTQDAKSLELLRRGLRPFILRRTKGQVACDLPEKTEQTIYCRMGAEQRRLYDEMRDHYRDSLLGLVRRQGMGRSAMHVLEALLRLRQVACHPALLDPKRPDGACAKLDVLCPFLDQLLEEGHKSLVFSQFTSMLAIVRRQLDDRGIKYAYLDGRTRDRQEVVTQFQTDPDCGVFLISLKAGGFGLNLTAADYVFLFDPWWNPAVENQAIDRSHRLGQERPVFAYRLICRNTVEEKIEKLQNQKRGLADALLQEDTSLLKDLTSEDLEMLLS